MAGDNPGAWYNVRDASLRAGQAITDVAFRVMVYDLRHLYELLLHDAAGETQAVYGHSHGEVGGATWAGLTKRRSLFTKSFQCGAFTYAQYTIGVAWTEVLRWRCWVGPFKRNACELRYSLAANNVKFRLERYDWVDSAASSTMTQGLQEQTADKGATSATWHTIDGQQYNGSIYTGSDTKLFKIDGPSSYADFDEMCAPAEFRLYVYADTASTTFRLYDVHHFEALTHDESPDTGWLD